jgi:hypothetical protein
VQHYISRCGAPPKDFTAISLFSTFNFNTLKNYVGAFKNLFERTLNLDATIPDVAINFQLEIIIKKGILEAPGIDPGTSRMLSERSPI